MIDRKHMSKAHEQQLGFCQSVGAGNLVFLSGVVSWDDDFQVLHPGDMAGQIEQIYSKLSQALQQFDLSFNDVVKETGFTTNMDEALGALSARAKYYDATHLPAATWVEVSRLAHPDLLLEIELVAAKN
ncbi:RidA family protein [Parasphingorhabdus sp.]|uniref:RidA family protein n=1 Tax=Parasphingorhabdus sp. TaxID=2709688 RepID=UPI003A93994F